MTYLNQNGTFSAQPCAVIAEEAGKRGRVFLTIQMTDGTTKKIDARSFVPPIQFAPAEPSSKLIREYKNEARVRALRNIGAI